MRFWHHLTSKTWARRQCVKDQKSSHGASCSVAASLLACSICPFAIGHKTNLSKHSSKSVALKLTQLQKVNTGSSHCLAQAGLVWKQLLFRPVKLQLFDARTNSQLGGTYGALREARHYSLYSWHLGALTCEGAQMIEGLIRFVSL